ncbi:DUF423 domain-containing protein [uncultured Psychromonas sp.]|uniref:DUF423 domain-containing protein n=1 Tax=uncultured Psychromonas sp. TaxID=173974 RepID=UPI002639489A|nr:DUF423 domain-containing protein [uncultured Psychromonas sp.]
MLPSKQSRCFIAVAALLGATAVMFGAYASHGLSTWASTAQVSQVQVAAQYQLFHAIILIVISLLSSAFTSRLLTISLYCFTLGTVCFSGSLYYLVFLGSKSLVLVTPLGGLLLILAWLLVAVAMLFTQRK